MPTVSQLLNANFNTLYNARVVWSALVTALEAAQRDAAAKIATPLRASQWFGQAADGAYLNFNRLSDDVLHATAQARLVYTLLDDMHELFYAKQQELKPLMAAAPGQYYVYEDGTVTYQQEVAPSGSGTYGGDYAAAVNGPREHAAAAIPAIMKAVNEADAKYTAALRLLDVIPRTDTNLTSWQGQAQDAQAIAALSNLDLAAIPRDNPAAAAAWWAALTDDQKQEYVAFAPKLIGMTDGLPATVRDQVNRLTLKEEKYKLQKELDYVNGILTNPTSVRSELPPKYRDPRNAELDKQELEQQINSIDKLEGKIDYQLGEQENTYNQPVPAAFLLNYSLAGNGQAVVSIGNPDTADNVTISVPGTGASFSKASGEIDRATAIQGSATVADPTKQTASIAWIGYDAPQSIPFDATREVFADNAAPALARFDAGLDAARQGDPAHVTAIGHSYGSLVVGKSLDSGHLTIDKVIFLGSPGVGVDNVNELPISPQNVYAGAIAEDPVPIASVHGTNPARPEFGAQDLPIESHRGGLLPFDSDTHSAYWDRDSVSLKAIGKIAVGQQP